MARSLFSQLLLLEGDRGARALLESEEVSVEFFPTSDHGILADVDTAEDLLALESRASAQPVDDTP